MTEPVRVKFYIRTDAIGSECEDVIEFSREEWDAMSEQEREEEMKEYAFNHMEWGFKVVSAEEEG